MPMQEITEKNVVFANLLAVHDIRHGFEVDLTQGTGIPDGNATLAC